MFWGVARNIHGGNTNVSPSLGIGRHNACATFQDPPQRINIWSFVCQTCVFQYVINFRR